ncbi:MAG: hypothetical protein CM15mP47_0050 [Methanobacteriota archaeon]|nr:MAG: hypothetical protein CM15mP47_0050 [Euryarchaeota archaeon]
MINFFLCLESRFFKFGENSNPGLPRSAITFYGVWHGVTGIFEIKCSNAELKVRETLVWQPYFAAWILFGTLAEPEIPLGFVSGLVVRSLKERVWG